MLAKKQEQRLIGNQYCLPATILSTKDMSAHKPHEVLLSRSLPSRTGMGMWVDNVGEQNLQGNQTGKAKQHDYTSFCGWVLVSPGVYLSTLSGSRIDLAIVGG